MQRWQRWSIWGVGLALPFSLLISVLVFVGGSAVACRTWGWKPLPHTRLLVAIAALLLAVTLSHGRAESWQGLANYLPWLLVSPLWLQLSQAQPEAKQALGRSLVVGSIPLALFGYLQIPLAWFGQLQLIPHILIFDSIAFAPPTYRPTAVLLNPNALALYLLMCLAIAAAVYRHGWLLNLVHVPLIYWTESRNIWLVGLALVGAIALRQRWRLVFAGWLAGLGLCVGAINGWSFSLWLLPERLANRLNGITVAGTTAYTAAIRRWDGWLFAIDLIRERPLTGWGWHRFYDLYGSRPLEPVLEYLGHAHNIILHIGAEGGLLVAIAFTGLWLWLLWRWQGWPWAIAAYVLAGMLDIFYLDGRFNLIFWLALAVAWPQATSPTPHAEREKNA